MSQQWSNSSLMTVQTCGHKYYLKHIKGDRRPSGLSAKRGIAVHAVAKEAHKRQMARLGTWRGDAPLITEEPGSARSIEEAKDIAATSFAREIGRGIVYSKDEKAIGIPQATAHHKDAAIELSALYVTEVAPPVIPVAVERKVVIKPQDSQIILTGYIDLVQDDQGDVIRDLKTKEKAPWEGEAKVSQQLTMYTLMRLADTGVMPRASRLVQLVRTPKRHEMSVVVQETTRESDDIARLVRRLNVAVESVEKGVFVPADESAPGSPCAWCEYADGTCKFVRARS